MSQAGSSLPASVAPLVPALTVLCPPSPKGDSAASSRCSSARQSPQNGGRLHTQDSFAACSKDNSRQCVGRCSRAIAIACEMQGGLTDTRAAGDLYECLLLLVYHRDSPTPNRKSMFSCGIDEVHASHVGHGSPRTYGWSVPALRQHTCSCALYRQGR